MASYGEFLSNGWYSSSKGDYVYLEFAWVVTSTSIENNQKEIYWEFRGKRAASGYVMSGPFKLIIDGETVYTSANRIELRNGTIIATGKKTLTHKSDGTRSFDVYMEGAIYWNAVNCTGSETFTLDTIPRGATITAASDFTDQDLPTVTYSNLAGNSVDELAICIADDRAYGGYTAYRTLSKTGTSYTFPEEDVDVLKNLTINTLRISFVLRTKIAGQYYYSVVYKTFTVTENDTTRPTISMSVSPVNTGLDAQFRNLYIQGLSKVQVSLDITTKYNAEVSDSSITVGGVTYGSPYISDYLTESGDFTVKGRVKDSRGFYGTTDETITVIPYAKPKIQNVTARRCDKNGNLTDSGTYLKITATRSYYPVVSDGVQRNFCKIEFSYKTEGASHYTYGDIILDQTDLSSDEVVTEALLDGNLLTTKSYRVEVRAVDDIGNIATTEIIVPTDKVYWHRDGARNALGLGKYNEQDNALDSAWDIHMNEHKITGLADPVNDSDAVTLGFLRQFIETYLK